MIEDTEELIEAAYRVHNSRLARTQCPRRERQVGATSIRAGGGKCQAPPSRHAAADHHLAPRSRPMNNSSHMASIRIGLPHIRIDLASPAEAGSATAGNGARSLSARAP